MKVSTKLYYLLGRKYKDEHNQENANFKRGYRQALLDGMVMETKLNSGKEVFNLQKEKNYGM